MSVTNRRLVAATIVGAVLFAATGSGSAAPASGARAKCPSSGSTLAANNVARVFTRNKRVYACATRAGKPILIGPDETQRCGAGGCEGVSRVALVGRYVAFVAYVSSNTTSSSAVVVVDSLRRKRALKWDSTTDDDTASTSTSVSALVLSPRGNPAWTTASTTSGQHGIRYAVHVHDGQTHGVVDPGPAVDDTSLAASDDGTIFWISGDQPRTARLP
jgi:hypothetical protein